MSGPILITIPGYVALPGSQKAASGRVAIKSKASCESSEESDEFLKPKKRRLDHLTWEEKIQRKKLKNRVAAQTSRDRKKQKMDEMEQMISDLQMENDSLKNNYLALEKENVNLREKNSTLEQQMKELQERMDKQEKAIFQRDSSTTVSEAQAVSKTLDLGSAASKNVDPLQKGLLTDEAMRLWRVIALCLVYKICSPATSSTSASWKSLPSPSLQISATKWQTIVRQMAEELPRMRAPYHHCLDQWWGPEQNSWNPVEQPVEA